MDIKKEKYTQIYVRSKEEILKEEKKEIDEENDRRLKMYSENSRLELYRKITYNAEHGNPWFILDFRKEMLEFYLIDDDEKEKLYKPLLENFYKELDKKGFYYKTIRPLFFKTDYIIVILQGKYSYYREEINEKLRDIKIRYVYKMLFFPISLMLFLIFMALCIKLLTI